MKRNTPTYLIFAVTVCIWIILHYHLPSLLEIQDIWKRETNEIKRRFSSMNTKTTPEPGVKRLISKVNIEPMTNASPNIVVVIPYRNRTVHLKTLLEHLANIARTSWRLKTIIVEQQDKHHFRRGWLMNIGIHETKERFIDDTLCVVTHDVDMIADSKVDYSWCARPTQICSELSRYNGSIPYVTYAGRVVQAYLKHWYIINGFTNTAFGWGGEDDDLHQRFRVNDMLTHRHLRRPAKGFGKCDELHDIDHTKRKLDSKSYKYINAKIRRMARGSGEWRTDGLNSLSYIVSEEYVDQYGAIHLIAT